jgi:hypothetical protein
MIVERPAGIGKLVGEDIAANVSYILHVVKDETGTAVVGHLTFDNHQQARDCFSRRDLVLHLEDGRKLKGVCTTMEGDFVGAGSFF